MSETVKRRIAPKRHVWSLVKRGQIMSLPADLEGSGTQRSGVPYATPNYAFITEWGDCLTDLAGNYLNTGQVFPRKPEWLTGQPAALLLQRMENGQEWDSEERPPYWGAMGAIAWRIEQAAHAYGALAEEFGDERTQISFTDINAAFKDGEKKGTEEVFEVPLRDENGEIVKDVRYHPDRRKISYRFNDDDPNSPYYAAHDNQYYIDSEDGSKWKWVEPTVAIKFYNGDNYDVPISRSNFQRVGFDPEDATFMYARATITDRQKPKNHTIDLKHLAYMVALYGPQGEDGLNLGRIIDPKTGEFRPSEALAAYLEENKRHPNPIRFVRGGAFMPDDGSMHDSAKDHGAAYDAAVLAALENLCWDIAPEICGKFYEQTDEKDLRNMLTGQSPYGSDFNLYSLPRREGGKSHSELPYYYSGTDDQMGRFKKHIFLRADGSFHKATYNGKLLKDLSIEEWEEYLSLPRMRGNPDRLVRVESQRRFPAVMPVEDVFQTSQAQLYRDRTPDIKRDVRYFKENEEMLAKLSVAIGNNNRRQRFGQTMPQSPLLEDEFPGLFGEIYFQDEAVEIERRRAQRGGPSKLLAILETLRNGMENVYKPYMRGIDHGIRQLCLKAHPIDYYIGLDPDDPAWDSAEEVLNNFKEMCKRVYGKFKKKDWPYLNILEELTTPLGKDPRPGQIHREPKGGNFNFETIGEALRFRKQLALRAMRDYHTLATRVRHSDYMDGYVDKHFCSQYYGADPLLLFADADPGDPKKRSDGGEGPAPHVVDEHGREISFSFLKSQDPSDVIKMIDSEKWRYRFYRLRSEMTVLQLAQRFVDLGMKEEIPDAVRELYEADKNLRDNGFPNEDVRTSRIPTQETWRYDLEQLKVNAGNPLVLERHPNPLVGEAAHALQYDEGLRLLGEMIKEQEGRTKRKPQRSADLIIAGRHDPETDLPLDFIPNIIDRDESVRFEDDPNFVVIDVPAWHLRHPIKQPDVRLPENLLAVPYLTKGDKDAIRGDKKNGAYTGKKKVILREIETGRLFHPGPASIHAMPKRSDTDFSIMMAKIQGDYERAGIKLGRNPSLLAIEGLYPVAHTRDVDPSYQSLKMPSLQFDGLVYPQISGLGDTPVTAIVLPVDYCPQELHPGEPLRLREMAADFFANIHGEPEADTGHTYETVLEHVIGIEGDGHVKGMLLDEFNRKAKSGDIPPEIIRATGVLGARDLEQRLNRWISSKWLDRSEQRVLVALFRQVNKDYFESGRDESKNAWALFNILSAPMAALRRKGEPVPPYAYRAPLWDT